jgi:hypothetical protein
MQMNKNFGILFNYNIYMEIYNGKMFFNYIIAIIDIIIIMNILNTLTTI